VTGLTTPLAAGAPQLSILTTLDRAAIAEVHRRSGFLWLDLPAPSEGEVDALGELFGLHPLALRDARSFGQRPKINDYNDHLLLVFYGARLNDDKEPEPVEVHVFICAESVVTLHRNDCGTLDALRRRLGGESAASLQWVVYRILDELTDSFMTVLESMDNELDGLEEAIIAAPTDEQLARLFRLKRALSGLRRAVGPARDLFQRAPEQIAALPGFDHDTHDYFRDVYDRLLRTSEQIDSYRDVLTSAMDVYLSTSSNRLNVVMQRLTLIATVFLPLTFVTGFFGQNFGWLVAHINGFGSFLTLGVGGLALLSLVMMVAFGRAGWLSSPGGRRRGNSGQPPAWRA
jgi:magnesium transporter